MDEALKNKLRDELYEISKRIHSWDLSTMNIKMFNPKNIKLDSNTELVSKEEELKDELLIEHKG